jgi:hypothetical protein
MSKDKKGCVATFSRPPHYTQMFECSNPAKYGDFCGIHSPEKREKRARGRGPTEFERGCHRRQLTSSVIDAARAVLTADAGSDYEMGELKIVLEEYDAA